LKVTEQYLKSKTNIESDCEDAIFISDNFSAVIDGVTSKSRRKFNNESSGTVCSKLLKKALVDLHYKSTAFQAVEFLTSTVFAMYKDLGIEEHLKNYSVERASACIVIYSNYKQEIWMVGDCQCRIDNVCYSNFKTIDNLLSNLRSLYIQTELEQGKSCDDLLINDTGREFILPLLERQSLFQNSSNKNEFTYGVIDGFKVPESEIKIIKLSDPKTIILASDGYPRLFKTLEESEEYLKKILDQEPLCYKEFKSTKGLKPGNSSFDDRAYIKMEIE
jgi:glycerophosphoryl diester phosphodiesterase